MPPAPLRTWIPAPTASCTPPLACPFVRSLLKIRVPFKGYHRVFFAGSILLGLTISSLRVPIRAFRGFLKGTIRAEGFGFRGLCAQIV